MKTITFALQKGGTGKTSIAVSVATELAKKSKVVILDADPQGNASAWYKKELSAELSDVLLEKVDMKEALVSTGIKNLYMIPTAGIEGGLSNYQETKAASNPYAIQMLTEQLAKVFDYCIIDTSPHFGALEESCMIPSDMVVPVMMIDRFSFDGLEIFFANLANMKKRFRLGDAPKVKQIVLNAFDKRIALQKAKIDAVKKTIPENIAMLIIPVDQAFKKAQDTHEPVDMVEPKKETLLVLGEIADAIRKEA